MSIARQWIRTVNGKHLKNLLKSLITCFPVSKPSQVWRVCRKQGIEFGEPAGIQRLRSGITYCFRRIQRGNAERNPGVDIMGAGIIMDDFRETTNESRRRWDTNADYRDADGR